MKVFKKFFVTFMTCTLLFQSLPLYGAKQHFIKGSTIRKSEHNQLKNVIVPVLNKNGEETGRTVLFTDLVDKFGYDLKRMYVNVKKILKNEVNLSDDVRRLGEKILHDIETLNNDTKNNLLTIPTTPEFSMEEFNAQIQMLGNLEYDKKKFLELAKRETETSFVALSELTDMLTLFVALGGCYTLANTSSSLLMQFATMFTFEDFSLGKILHDKIFSFMGSQALQHADSIDSAFSTMTYPVVRSVPFLLPMGVMANRTWSFDYKPTFLGTYFAHAILNKRMATPFVTEAPKEFRNNFVEYVADFHQAQGQLKPIDGRKISKILSNPDNPQIEVKEMVRAGWKQSSLRTAIRFTAIAVGVVAVIYAVKSLGKSNTLSNVAASTSPVLETASDLTMSIVEAYFSGQLSFE